MEEEPPAKRPRTDEPGADEGPSLEERTLSGQLDDELEALLGSGGLDEDFAFGSQAFSAAGSYTEPPEEAARRAFAEQLSGMDRIHEEELPELLEKLKGEAQAWGALRRLRSVALLMVHVARSSRTCRAAMVAQGLPLLGEVLQDSVAHLDSADAVLRQEAGMRALACLTCLWSLPIGRATMWEHRVALGKPFDKLHRWCGQTKTALGAELRTPTVALCKRWRTQPKPALQDTSPEQKAVRLKVVEIIRQGLLGHAGNSPASPAFASMQSPGVLPPATTAAEVEAALFGKYKGNTPEYRAHARMLRSNLALPGNMPLRTRILQGDLSAEELVTLDSAHLAPEALQEKRRVAEVEAMKAVIDKAKLEHMPSIDRRDSTWNPSTAPLAEHEIGESEDNTPRNNMPKVSSNDAELPPTPISTPLKMEPPPTPFQDGLPATPLRGPMDYDGAMPQHDVMETPAQGEEDEQQAELLRWFAQPVG